MTAGIPILMYHEVAGRADTASPLAVAPESFAQHLAALADRGYTTITAATLAAAWSGGASLPERPVVITFDDGFADFHQAALPLLAEHGFTATVFVTTGWIADAGPPAPSRPGRMLTWQQLAESAAAGIEIAAHTRTHPQLDQLPAARLAEELGLSRRLLEDRLGVAVAGMAYPFGYSDDAVRRAVRAAGYRYACVVANAIARPGSDLFALPRLTVRRATRPQTFARVVQGQQVALAYAGQRSLTKGYAVVRRARAVLSASSRAGAESVRAGGR